MTAIVRALSTPLATLLIALLMLVGGAAPGRTQDRSVRFEIRSVGDSTFTFDIGKEQWVSPGRMGIAIDPRRRDQLVARFRITTVESGRATALITGLTTPLTVDHLVVMREPPRRWYIQRAFWIGLLGGALVGFGVGKM